MKSVAFAAAALLGPSAAQVTVADTLSAAAVDTLVAATVRDTDQNTSTVAGIISTAYAFLESHLLEGEKDMGPGVGVLPYHFYEPSLEKYSPNQWLWDSGAHMIVWSNKDVGNSVLDLRTMLQLQQSDGRVPEMVFWQNCTPAENANILKQYSTQYITDLTQMPVLPYSLRAIYAQSGKDKAVLEEFLAPLVNYFQWWRDARDLDKDGLVYVIHGWESGLDASPAYDEAYGVYVTDVNFTSYSELYPRFGELIKTYKNVFKWNMTSILGRSSEGPKVKDDNFEHFWFVEDVGLNCVYAAGWEILGDLALEFGDASLAERCYAESKITSTAIHSLMYSEEHEGYRTVYKDTTGQRRFARANTVQNLFPLLLSDTPLDRMETIVGEVTSEMKFSAPFGIPTVALDDPQFCPTFDYDLMWRGPIWGITNWFVMEGLHKHGYNAEVGTILDKWTALVSLSGIYEHYNPLTGEAYGAVGLGMSTLIVDWLYRTGRA